MLKNNKIYFGNANITESKQTVCFHAGPLERYVKNIFATILYCTALATCVLGGGGVYLSPNFYIVLFCC